MNLLDESGKNYLYFVAYFVLIDLPKVAQEMFMGG